MMSRHLFNHITDQLGTFRSAVFTWKDSWASIFFIHFFCSWHQARSYLLHIFIKLQTTKNTKSSLSGRMDTAQHFHLSNLHWWRTLGKWYSGPMVYGYTASMLCCLKNSSLPDVPTQTCRESPCPCLPPTIHRSNNTDSPVYRRDPTSGLFYRLLMPSREYTPWKWDNLLPHDHPYRSIFSIFTNLLKGCFLLDQNAFVLTSWDFPSHS